MLDEVKLMLGDNFKAGDDALLQSIIEDLTKDALFISNRSEETLLKSEIKEAVISTYLLRGAEGLNSLSQGGVSSSFKDIKDKMKKDIISNGKRIIF